MKFVTGGAFQGKKETACRLFGYRAEDFADGSACAYKELLNCRAVCGLQELIWRALQEAYPVERLIEDMLEKNPQILIVSDEVGCGVVPVDQARRQWRELTGRICCRIAAASDTVVRVTAGIPTVLKGELP